MAKRKPQTGSAHAVYRSELTTTLVWERLSDQIGCKISRKARGAVIAAIRNYEGSLHLRADAQARSLVRLHLVELQRHIDGVLSTWRKLQSSETGQNLLGDLDVEIESAYGSRRSLSLHAAIGASERVQPFLRSLVDQDFAKRWALQLSESHSDASSSVQRIAAMLWPAGKTVPSAPERDLIWGLADALAGTIPIGASSGSSTSSPPTAFQRFVFELNRQLPDGLQIPRQSSREKAFAGWIAKRLKGWRGQRIRSRTR